LSNLLYKKQDKKTAEPIKERRQTYKPMKNKTYPAVSKAEATFDATLGANAGSEPVKVKVKPFLSPCAVPVLAAFAVKSIPRVFPKYQ
jgi:hypothetical protein